MTVTVALPDAEPDAAVIDAVPGPSALTIPALLTVATDELDDDQMKLVVTLVPEEFRAVALKLCVEPTVMFAEDGETVIVTELVPPVEPPVEPPEVPVCEPELVPGSPMPPMRPFTLVSPQARAASRVVPARRVRGMCRIPRCAANSLPE